MKKINILSKTVYNRIAAGEVVDRPYSAVKELVENSIDAGATDIEIYIENGGKQLIKVVDNGSGIYKDDLPAAFMPHATSKITTIRDLDVIETLGFRGEALASIASVAKVEIVSVTKGNPAYKLCCEGGAVGEVESAALDTGTVITVRDLFYNTPVRAKFMKPNNKEESDITAFVSRFILGNPKICFKYFADGKLELQSYGGGLEEAIAQVYGAKIIPQCFKVDAEKDGIHVSGFISNQNFFKPNKSYQSVFLNGRYIINSTIATAISNAYASYAMKRQYPFYVLNIEVPTEIVDVNVHPNKADVRFSDTRLIFGVIYKIISAILDGTAEAPYFMVGSGKVPEIKSTAAGAGGPNGVYADDSPANEVPLTVPRELVEKYKPEEYLRSPEDVEIKPPKPKPKSPSYFLPRSAQNNRDSYYDAEADLRKYGYHLSSDFTTKVANNEYDPWHYSPSEQQKIDLNTCEYCGELFNTYLLFQLNDVIYIVDQHAAHERILFDKLMDGLKEHGATSQPLLYSYYFDINTSEAVVLERHVKALNQLGFGIYPCSKTKYRVDAIPADLRGINLKLFIGEILSDLSDNKDLDLGEILRDKLAMTACKHAVKAGKIMDEDEIKALVFQMEGNVGMKCPHGRPVCVQLTKTELEKMFKRIV